MKVRIKKWGNSLALRIPKSFAMEAHVGEGSTVDVFVKDGKLIVSPTASSYPLEELLAKVHKDNIHHEISTDNPVGREVW